MENPYITNASRTDTLMSDYAKFYTKTRWLTPYSLACGYIENYDSGTTKITLALDGSCFHVKAYDYKNHMRECWKTYEKLGNARKEFLRQVKKTFNQKEAQ